MTDEERARKYALERKKNLHLSQRDTNLIHLAYLHGLKDNKPKWHKIFTDNPPLFRKKKKPVPVPVLSVGTKIKFDNGKLYRIEKRVDLYNYEEYCLRSKDTWVCYSIDYLIGKIWEVVE